MRGEENWEGEAGGGWVPKSCPVKLLSYNFFVAKENMSHLKCACVDEALKGNTRRSLQKQNGILSLSCE